MKRIRFNVSKMRCERIVPAKNAHPGKVMLYCHGGGFICGDIEYAAVLGSKLAEFVHIEVLSFEYRLAPEYKYPAPLNDASKMWQYLKKKGYKAEDIILAGDSAGGNIVLELALKLREKHEIPAGMILFSPFTDLTLSSGSYEEWEDSDLILTKEYIINSRDLYLSEKDIDFKDSKYSPLFADLTGLPPTLVQVGRNEILLDDSVKLVKKMRASGGKAVLQIFERGWHVFQQMPISMAAHAMRKTAHFTERILRQGTGYGG